jgi:hypothetical protein
MKSIRPFFLFALLLAIYMMSGFSFVGCTKKTEIRDTLTVRVTDTVRITDTVFDITSGLVAYYTFNGGSLNDGSVYQNNISFNNATPTADRNGKANNAFLFDGASNYMTVPNSPSLSPGNITLYAIIKINGFYTGAAHDNMILVKGHHDAAGEYFMNFLDWPNTGAQPDTVNEYFDGAFGDNNSPGTGIGIGPQTVTDHLSAGVWYKLAFSYDGLTAKLYINGVLKNTKTGSVQMTPSSLDLYIGTNPEPPGLYPFWFNGVIDEIRIYNRALPDEAIAQLSNLGE